MNPLGAIRLLLGGCVLTVSLYACTQQVSKEDYVSDVNKLCRETQQDLDAYAETLREATSADDVRAAVEQGGTVLARFHDEVQTLERPEEDRRTLDRWLTQIDEMVDLMRGLEEATASGDLDAVEQVTQEAESAQSEAERLAMEYGIEDCAR